MMEQERDSWQFGFWSALTLEMLARAALSSISPTLVADNKSWHNIYYAFGYQPNVTKFTPKSVNTGELFARVESIFPTFTREMLNFSIVHINRRNSELHSGALPFDELGTSAWLSRFYSCCKCFLATIGESLELVFGEREAQAAETLIASISDEAAKSVKKTINAHATIWNDKKDEEREKLVKQAESLASRATGHRAPCPACSSSGLIHGSAIDSPTHALDSDGELVVEKQPMLPASFECSACGLKISGFSKLNACGLGDTYTSTSYYDSVEFFGADQDDPYRGFEEDNNEP